MHRFIPVILFLGITTIPVQGFNIFIQNASEPAFPNTEETYTTTDAVPLNQPPNITAQPSAQYSTFPMDNLETSHSETNSSQNSQNSSSTSGVRRGRLVGGSWDPRNLALQFSGSPVFSGGFVPMTPNESPPPPSPPPQSQPPSTSISMDSDSRVIFPQEKPSNSRFPVAVSIPSQPTHNVTDNNNSFEDRYLTPYNPGFESTFPNSYTFDDVKDSVRKGPDTVPEMYKSLPPPFQQQLSANTVVNNAESGGTLDPSQLAVAHAAVQAAHNLFSQFQNNGQNSGSSSGSSSQMGQLISNALPILASLNPQNQEQPPPPPPPSSEPQIIFPPINFGDPSPHVTHTSSSSMSSPSILKDSFTGFGDNDNKRYSGGQQFDPFNHYHDITYAYYSHPPPPPPHMPPPYPPPPPPYPMAHKPHSGLPSVLNAFSSIRENVVGTAHRIGEKIASYTGGGHHGLGVLVPAATTIILGGLALKLLTANNNNSLGVVAFRSTDTGPILNDTISLRVDNITEAALNSTFMQLAENDTKEGEAEDLFLTEKSSRVKMNKKFMSERFKRYAEIRSPVLVLQRDDEPRSLNPRSSSQDSSSNRGSRALKSDPSEEHSELFALLQNAPDDGKPITSFRSKRSTSVFSHSRPVLVLQRLTDEEQHPANTRKKRSVFSNRPVLVFAKEDPSESEVEGPKLTNLMGIGSIRQKRASRMDENIDIPQSRMSPDGTFTEEEMNKLVSRLDPVQRQFLQKLQWYGFDRWKEMPCAKFILCDVMVHSDLQHIYDLQRRIGIFLSLMDDESARKVEVMIKDLILSIEARDCSQFYCEAQQSLFPPPPVPPPPPPPPPSPLNPSLPSTSALNPPRPFENNQFYQTPYAFPHQGSGGFPSVPGG